MAHSVAEHLVATLVQAGVKQIYGVVGDSLNPVTDALRRSTLKWVDVRHEESGAFAAGAEAQLTGQLAVCAGSCGPGNLPLINGLFDAHRSRAPVLAIAAHIPSSEVGTGYFQETHPVSKRGVSVVVLPGDVAALEAPADAVARGRISNRRWLPPTSPCGANRGPNCSRSCPPAWR